VSIRTSFSRARAARRAARGAAHPVARGRDGMTLIEVIIATVILGGALMSLAGFVAKFAHTVSDADIRGIAAELAADRIETVKAATQYSSIDSLYATTEGRGTITGYPKFTRQTLVQRVGGGSTDLVDYRIVTVIVMSPPLRAPVRKTTIISDF
jgi:prepilin-type N-terminal cleavage/methylation domain-containing protein